MRAPRVTVVGAGSWGTTLASLVAAKAPTTIWARRPELAQEIDREHRNPDYLDGFDLHPELRSTADFEAAVAESDVLLVAVPTKVFRETLQRVAKVVRPWVPVVSLSKGFERGTRKRMTQLIEEELPGHPAGVLAGPNLAREVLQGYAAAAVIATHDHSVAEALQMILHARVFRVYTGTDVIGVEVAGALKNVIAIAAGMADGLGTGDNTRALTISRGVAEMTRLGTAMGGDPRTFAGLAGMGDVIATCISPLSRNRTVGVNLASGRTIDEVLSEMNMVAEGVRTARTALELGEEYGVEMPIAAEVDAVVSGTADARHAFRGLLQERPGQEHEAG